MGKYMRKSKGTGVVGLMEVSHSHSHTQPSLGVRTRAKTLALQRLQSSSSSAVAAGKEEEEGGGGGSYLQLRSRRLEKVSPVGLDGKRQKLSQMHMNLQQKSPSSRFRRKGTEEKIEAGDEEEEKVNECLSDENIEGLIKEDKESRGGDFGAEETSFGENVLEFGVRGRSSRESTPCSLIRDADTIRTPGSSTRPSTRSITRSRDHLIPATDEMEAFFSGAEELQQRKFLDKYNFDPVTDRPLPGHFEWEKLNR